MIICIRWTSWTQLRIQICYITRILLKLFTRQQEKKRWNNAADIWFINSCLRRYVISQFFTKIVKFDNSKFGQPWVENEDEKSSKIFKKNSSIWCVVLKTDPLQIISNFFVIVLFIWLSILTFFSYFGCPQSV